MTDDVRFWTLDYDHGTVHVDEGIVPAPAGRVEMPFNPWLRSRCGLLRREQSVSGVSVFADVRLCHTCWLMTPEADRSGLFEHDDADG